MTPSALRLLFLDFDGVVNHLRFFQEYGNPELGGKDQLLRFVDGTVGGTPEYKRQATRPDGSPKHPEFCETAPKYSHQRFCPHSASNITKIVRETGAQIVVSSTWRLGRSITELQEILRLEGIVARVVGKTPHCHGAPRGYEIAWWLKTVQDGVHYKSTARAYFHPELLVSEDRPAPQVEAYAVLDDDRDMSFDVSRIFWEQGVPAPSLGYKPGQVDDVWNHLVKTTNAGGLTDELARIAIDRLNSGTKPEAPHPPDLINSYDLTLAEVVDLEDEDAARDVEALDYKPSHGT